MTAAPPYLTPEEIADITAPLTQGSARRRYLEQLGLQVQSRPNGQPLVGRAHFEEVMRARAAVAANDGSTGAGQAPNFNALRNRVAYARGKAPEGRKPARP